MFPPLGERRWLGVRVPSPSVFVSSMNIFRLPNESQGDLLTLRLGIVSGLLIFPDQCAISFAGYCGADLSVFSPVAPVPGLLNAAGGLRPHGTKDRADCRRRRVGSLTR